MLSRYHLCLYVHLFDYIPTIYFFSNEHSLFWQKKSELNSNLIHMYLWFEYDDFWFFVSLGRSIMIYNNHRNTDASLSNDMVIIWWCVFRVVSTKPLLLLSYIVLSGTSNVWWFPKWRPDEDVVVDSFRFLKPSKFIVLFFGILIISLFLFKFCRYAFIVSVILKEFKLTFPVKNYPKK